MFEKIKSKPVGEASQPTKEKLNADAKAVMTAARERSKQHPRNLGIEKRKYVDSDSTHPLATHKSKWGVEESLSSVIVMGDTLFGISRLKEGDRTAVRLSILPFGKYSDRTSASSVHGVEVAALSRPGSDGVIPTFDTFRIGRNHVEALTGVADDTMSRKQGELTVTQTGYVEIYDGDPNGMPSGNGCLIINDFDNFEGIQQGFSGEARQNFVDFCQGLQENPAAWSAQYEDQNVVYDAQR